MSYHLIRHSQRITRSKSDIIDVYREKSQPKNWTLWNPHRDCHRSGQQAHRFDTLNSIWEVVGEPVEAVISETKAVESADKNVVIYRFESLGQVNEYGCIVLSFIDCGYDIVQDVEHGWGSPMTSSETILHSGEGMVGFEMVGDLFVQVCNSLGQEYLPFWRGG